MTQPVQFESHSASWSSGRGGWCGSSGESLTTLSVDGTPANAFGTQPITSTVYYSFVEPGRYVVPPGAFFNPASATGGSAAVDPLSGHPVLTIAENAKGQVVFDLGSITTFAYTQFTGATGLGSTTAWPGFPALVTGASGYVPSPTLTVANKSSYSGFVVVGDATSSTSVSSSGAFEGVAPSNGIYPRERYDLQYNPATRTWQVLNRTHA